MICGRCGWWERFCHCGELKLFNTTKDKLFEFIDYKNFKQPTEVKGKGHWNRLLKQHGLIDDVKGIRPPEDKPISKEFIANEIKKELAERGLYHKLIKRRNR